MAMENTGLCFMFHVEHWVMFLHLCFTWNIGWVSDGGRDGYKK